MKWLSVGNSVYHANSEPPQSFLSLEDDFFHGFGRATVSPFVDPLLHVTCERDENPRGFVQPYFPLRPLLFSVPPAKRPSSRCPDRLSTFLSLLLFFFLCMDLSVLPPSFLPPFWWTSRVITTDTRTRVVSP